MSQNTPISSFLEKHYLHFNAAALVDAARGYRKHLAEGKKMMVTLAGAMSTAELGISFAEMIRRDKVHIISCTGANLEEDIMNLVAHSHYKRIPNYRDLTPEQEWELLGNHLNRVTDTCIPEEEAGLPIPVYLRKKLFAGCKNIFSKYGRMPKIKVNVCFLMSSCSGCSTAVT
jgi:deoxyhypusine synthase